MRDSNTAAQLPFRTKLGLSLRQLAQELPTEQVRIVRREDRFPHCDYVTDGDKTNLLVTDVSFLTLTPANARYTGLRLKTSNKG
jgi:hypothetical protein